MSTLEPPARVEKPGGFAHWLTRMQMKHGRKLVIAMPYVWLILLFLLSAITGIGRHFEKGTAAAPETPAAEEK